MLKKLVIFIIFLLVIAAAAPAIDGFFFKKYFNTYVNSIVASIPSSSGMHVSIKSYQQGWLRSTATILVKFDDKSSSDDEKAKHMLLGEFPIDIVVQHGPVVFVDNTPKLAYANVNYKIDIKLLNNSVTFDSLFALLSNKVTTNYHVGELAFPGLFKSNGLNGEVITSINGISKFINTLNIGEITSQSEDSHDSVISINVSPAQIYTEAEISYVKGEMLGKTRVLSDGFSLTLDSNKLNATKIFYSSTDSITKNTLQYQSTLNISQLSLPLKSELTINNLILEHKLTNIHYEFPEKEIKSTSVNPLASMITPASTLTLKASFDTDAGRSEADITMSKLAFPDDVSMINYTPKQYNIVIKAQIPKQTVQTLLEDYIAYNTEDSDQTNKPDIEKMLSRLVLQGFLGESNGNYTFALSATENKFVLNGFTIYDRARLVRALNRIIAPPPKRECTAYITNIYGQMVCGEYATPAPQEGLSDDDMSGSPADNHVAPDTQAANEQPVAAPTPTPAPASNAPTVAQTQEQAPAETYHCYWEQKSEGISTWMQINELNSKDACYNMDSCNGGKGASRGGCFKWATAPDAAGVAWQ